MRIILAEKTRRSAADDKHLRLPLCLGLRLRLDLCLRLGLRPRLGLCLLLHLCLRL